MVRVIHFFFYLDMQKCISIYLMVNQREYCKRHAKGKVPSIPDSTINRRINRLDIKVKYNTIAKNSKTTIS